MSLTAWLLGFDEKGDLHRLPITIFNGKKTGFKNQILKVAELLINLEDRKPQKITRAIFFKLKFDDKGALEKDYFDEMGSLQMSSIDFLGNGLSKENIIAQEKYRIKYGWYPTPREIKLINQYLNKKELPLNELLR